ncbi:MAG: gliding motility-associated C-terminal domain-containing protein [Flavobacteriales bacterium]
MRSISLFAILYLFSNSVCCQTPADWWFFGDNAGIHFSESGVVAASGSDMMAPEGCSSISDAFGNLLFYSDGDSVWDRNHNVMPNGTGLLGNESSAQSSLIVKKPGSSTIYYLFTTDALENLGASGLRYSAVDMSLNGGFGDVVAAEKNILLHQPCTEQLACVSQPNGFWLMSHSFAGTTWLAYEITGAGINTIAVSSNAGSSYTTGQIGYSKFSLDGSRFAAALAVDGVVEVFDFDQQTGTVSNPIQISTTNLTAAYGLEFSPNGLRLYVSAGLFNGGLYQYDLTFGTAAAISASEVLLSSDFGTGRGLQLGPDKRIYYTKPVISAMAAVVSPDELGASCNFTDSIVLLSPGTLCRQGTPAFVSSYLSSLIQFDRLCFGDSVSFSTDTVGVDSVIWNFGDVVSGTNDTSTQLFPMHHFTDTGNFLVELIIWKNGFADTNYRNVTIQPSGSLNLGLDTVICSSIPLILDVNEVGATYLWRGGDINPLQTISVDTTIWVTVFGVCDTLSDTLVVSVQAPPTVDIGPDTILCDQSGYVLKALVSDSVAYKWSTGDTIDSIFVMTSGTYGLSATNECGFVLAVANVTFALSPPDTLLLADTVICSSKALTLSVPVLAGVAYIWPDSSTSNSYVVDTSEKVSVIATSLCGSRTDVMQVDYLGNLPSFLGNDTAICDLDLITLDARAAGATYNWNTGDTSGTVQAGVESRDYFVTITRGPCTSAARIGVDVSDLFCEDIECGVETMNVFSPNEDGINDTWVVTSDCDIHTYNLIIFNRWGQLVHQSSEIATGWDGYINGQQASEGVYYYIMEFKDQVVVDVDRQEFRGSFTLVR